MCGITGIWSRSGTPPDAIDLGRMLAAIAHRGPEGSAWSRLDAGALLFGFLRLGFTDLPGGQQPLFSPDGALALLANGEVYDYEAIRDELRGRGHRFLTHSDCEVILALYAEHGPEFLDRLNGEFAFALWDQRRRELHLVRDRLGVKPLFYAIHDGRFVFASETKAILALPGMRREVEPRYFTGAGVGLVETSLTPFAGIRSVRPGHRLVVTAGGATEEPWWRPEPSGAAMHAEAAASEVRAAVDAAVRRRLHGSPPIALSLSSGLDSSILCGVMAATGHRVQAFTVGYDGASYDESARAAETARHFGANFTRVEVTLRHLADGLLDALHAIEIPTNNLTVAARIRLTRAVRDSGLKALMSGEGSDELFGGYPYFGVEWAARQRGAEGRAARAALTQREVASRGVFWERGALPAAMFGYPSAYEQRVRLMGRLVPWVFAPALLERLGAETPDRTARRELDPRRLAALSPFDRTRVISAGVLSAIIIPGLGDRVEMAGSLEGRVPYLDRDVIRCAYRLGEEHCIDPKTLTRKRVLRRAFADLLPPSFAPPVKHTRMAPSLWDLYGDAVGRGLLDSLLSPVAVRSAQIFSPAFVRALVWAWKASRGRSRFDELVGYVACTQGLHAVLIEDQLGRRARPPLMATHERVPPAAAAAAGA